MIFKRDTWVMAYRILLDHGFKGLKWAIIDAINIRRRGSRGHLDRAIYRRWINKYDWISPRDKREMAADCQRWTDPPVVSVLYNAKGASDPDLIRSIDSIRSQVYPHWEVIVVSDKELPGSTSTPSYRDTRIRWLQSAEKGVFQTCFDRSAGEFVICLDHQAVLPVHALYMMVRESQLRPAARILYSDEDVINDRGQRYHAHFKSDWNLDLFYSQNYCAQLSVVSRALVEQAGGFRGDDARVAMYDLILRSLRFIQPEQIVHIPRILYHANEAVTTNTQEQETQSLNEHLAGTGAAVVKDQHGYRMVQWPLPPVAPRVSIIIPSHNGYDLLRTAVTSVLDKTDYPNFDIMIIDHESDDEETLAYLAEVGQDPKVEVHSYQGPFNYSAINNFAVEFCEGEVVVLLNNDIEVIEDNWLTEMLRHACRPEIGAVGALLLYPDGAIQHAGVMVGFGERSDPVAGHAYHRAPGSSQGYFGRVVRVQNVTAVTGACLAVRKDLYQDVGGLNEHALAVAFNDVDFCLKLINRGYRNLYTPNARLYHHESASRGADDTHAKRDRFASEVAYMHAQWGDVLGQDPYFNPNLEWISGNCTYRFPPAVVRKPWRGN